MASFELDMIQSAGVGALALLVGMGLKYYMVGLISKSRSMIH